MRDFRQLTVWQKAHQVTLAAYRSTKAFPRDELFGLTSQIRRSASSIAANIAEGCGRRGGVDMARFLQIAMGSASELEYHFLLARNLELLPVADYERLAGGAIEVKRMLSSLIRKVHADS